MKICLCTKPGASRRNVRCGEGSGSCSLRQDLGERVLGVFGKVLARRAHLEEGKAAAQPTSTLDRQSLAITPRRYPVPRDYAAAGVPSHWR